MKTCYFIIPDLSAGGAERVSIIMARFLKKQGHKTCFVNLGYADGEMREWIECEFPIISFGCSRVTTSIFMLYRFMKEHPEAIFFSSREHVNIVGLLCTRFLNSKYIARIPNMPKNKLSRGLVGFKMKLIKFLNKHLLGFSHYVIAQNDEMRKQLIKFYHLSEDKVITINNPIDKEFILASANQPCNPYNNEEINILNVSNIAYSKGIDILLEAWPIIKNHIPRAHLYVVGRTETSYANTLISSVKDDPSITFLGFLKNPYPFFKHCNCFVLPSRMEGFPNVVLEAMCFDRPVVATTCVEVIKTIIQTGVNGYCCDVGNSEELAQCVLQAVNLSNIKNTYTLFDKQKFLDLFL